MKWAWWESYLMYISFYLTLSTTNNSYYSVLLLSNKNQPKILEKMLI